MVPEFAGALARAAALLLPVAVFPTVLFSPAAGFAAVDVLVVAERAVLVVTAGDVARFGGTFAGADAEAPPLAWGLETPLGLWARKEIVA